MTFDPDTTLIGELRSALESTTAELAMSRVRAQSAVTALELANSEVARRDARILELERLVEVLRCGDLMLYADAELDLDRARDFREHLGRCAECQTGLVDLVDLDAKMMELGAPREVPT